MTTPVAENSMIRLLARKRTTFTWLIPIALAVAAWFWGHPNLRIFALGIAMLVLGEMMRFWAAGTIHKDDIVATLGPYAFVRNPLYFGSLLLALGYGFMSGLGWIAWLVCLALFMIFHMAAILHEEAFLKVKFGQPYLVYLGRVPRLIPRPLPYRGDSAEAATFSWKQVIYNREPTTALVTAFAAVVFGALQLMHH